MRWLATHNPDFLPRRWTERPPTFNQKNDQTENDRLTRDLANMELALKRRISRKTTKNRTPKPEERLNDS